MAGVGVAKRRTVVAFAQVSCYRVSKMTTVTGMVWVVVVKRSSVGVFGEEGSGEERGERREERGERREERGERGEGRGERGEGRGERGEERTGEERA